MCDEIVLIRHGETLGQSSIRLNGITDVDLSPEGEEQLRAAAERLSGERFDRLLVSPLVRTHQSAQVVRPDMEQQVVPGFLEVNFGRWETWTWAEVAERDPVNFKACMAAEGDFQYPDGDSRYGFYDRVSAAALEHLMPAKGKTLAVVHKGIIKVSLAALTGAGRNGFVDHPCALGSVHRLHRVSSERWALRH